MQIAVGIPSHQESDTIAHVTRQVDEGLTSMFDPAACSIVNVDSDSPDRTPSIFLETPTRCRKVSFIINEQTRGKGRNVLRFFEYCVENGVTASAIVDGDLSSITPDWMPALLDPILRSHTDFVAPLYLRYRFDAPITNHFAYLMMRGFFGVELRQPIGGDFGFSPKFVEHLLRQPIDDSIRGYGIDIFLSMHAVGGGFRVSQASLGEKLHKPGITKWNGMTPQVIAAALTVARAFSFQAEDHFSRKAAPSMGDLEEYPNYELAQTVMKEARKEARALVPVYQAWLGKDADDAGALLSAFQINAEALPVEVLTDVWTDLLSAFVAHAIWAAPESSARLLAEQLKPALVVRIISFWNQMWGRPIEEMNHEIARQTALFRENLLARQQFGSRL